MSYLISAIGLASQRFTLRPLVAGAMLAGFFAIGLFGLAGADLTRLSVTAAIAAFFINAGVVGMYPLLAQAYPAALRASGTGFVIGVGRGGSALGPMLAGALFANGGSLLLVSLVMGLGGILAAFGLITVLAVVPLVVALAFIAVLRLPRDPAGALVEAPPRIRPTDPRVWPFLVAGFGMFTALGFIQVIVGFIVQDRLGLDAATTGLVTGGALLAAGVGMILAQAVIVPRSGWTPPTLLRVGAVIAVAGFVVLILDAGAVPLFAAILLIGLGLGIAMPGYTAGPTLLVSREEQGGLAGIVGATTGLTFVVAPTAGTALYGVWAPLPVIAGAVIMAGVAVFVLVHPRFRRVPAAAVSAGIE